MIQKAKALAAIGRSPRSGSRGVFTRDLSLGADATNAPSHRRSSFILTLALTLAAFLALTAAPASAVVQYPFLGQLSGTTTPSFFPQEIAVNDVSGQVLLPDSGRVSVFDKSSRAFTTNWDGSNTPAGSFAGSTTAAVDNTTGDVYVADSGNNVVDKFSSTGTYLCQITGQPGATSSSLSECSSTSAGTPTGSLSSPLGIAVDQATGNLYVSDQNNNVVDEFDSSGAYLSQLSGQPLTSPHSVAVDGASGQVLVADSTHSVYAFDAATGGFQTTFDGSNTPSGSFGSFGGFVAADDTTGDVYVSDSSDLVVDDLTSAGAYRGQITGTPSGAFSEPLGIGVDQANGEIYFADGFAHHDVDIFARAIVVPGVTTGSGSNLQPTSATVDGSVNPDGVQVSDCHFDYVRAADFNPAAPNPYAAGATAPCAETVGSGSSDVPVHADLTGLDPGTTYHFRLEASNANGSNQGTDATFETLPPPSIDAAAAQNLTPTDADLTAQINPRGFDTTYHFEWGTADCTANPCTSVPIPDGDIGSGTTDVSVMTHLTDLSANTTYHWRLLATNANGTVGAAVDHTFIYDTTGGSLPDNRGYEMVTPPQKNGSLIGAVTLVALQPDIAADGSRVIAETIQCFADATSCNGQHNVGVGSPYSFTRTPGGWQTTPLAPPASQFPFNTPWTYVADTGAAMFSMSTPPQGQDDFYKRQADGSFLDIGPITPPADGALGPLGGKVASSIQARTADLSHFVWPSEQREGFWPFDATTGPTTVYEYVGTGNTQPLLVGVTGGPGSTDLISACGTALGSSGTEEPPGMLSADGRSVYVTALSDGAGVPCPGGSGANASTPVPANAIYARLDGELPSAHTVPISQRSPADCTTPACTGSPPGDARFAGASADGSKAFFTSTQQLTDAASQDSDTGDTASAQGCSQATGPNGCNLYLYDFSRPADHQLTAVSAGDTSGNGPRVQGLMALSSDGSHAYFVAKGVLTATANAQGQTATDGANNLYAYDAASGDTDFVDPLPGSDRDEWVNGAGQPANVTPDGRFLVFTSSGRLTPDDSSASGAQQIFRYDAKTGALERISVGNNGFNDNGNRSAATPCELNGCSEDASIARARDAARSDPTMSDDGAFVFFQSPVALTARALDAVRIGTDNVGNPGYAQNLYEWHAGHVSLISDGRDTSVNAGSAPSCPGSQLGLASSVCLLGSDASGQNVFFTTADQLVPQDTDTELDYYDARVGGGFPFTPPPEPCQGDNCKPPPSSPPPVGPGGSDTNSGPGNQAPNHQHATPTKKKCKKHHVRHECNKGKKHHHRAKRRSVNP